MRTYGTRTFGVSFRTYGVIMGSLELATSVSVGDGFGSPLVTRERWAQMLGLPVGVVVAQADRGYWPQITVGKRVFINVEAVRVKAAERAQEFTL